MTTRTCSACGVTKNLSQFPRNGVDKTGATRHRPDCKECYGISRKIKRKKHNKFMSNARARTGEAQVITLKEWKEAVIFFAGGCAYCSKKQARRVRLTKDHVVPVSVGGLTVKKNIVPACTSCNSSKGDRPMLEWYVKQKWYSVERMNRIKEWTE